MKLFLLSFLSIFFLSVNAQENYLKKHQDYFELPRESIYVHTNKSVFVKGENMWYKGYAIDRSTNTLNDLVRNVQVSVFNIEGKKIKENMVLASDGIFINQIAIDSTFETGRYYLKAMTNYMNNFKESDAYFQTFDVVNEINKRQGYPKSLKVIVRPEGQSITYGLEANLGIKVVNDLGYTEASDIEILKNGKVIRKVTTSKSGLAMVAFTPKKNKEYEVKAISSNDLNKTVAIDNISSTGTSLHLTDVTKYVYLNITSKSISNQDGFKLVIYQDENIIELDIDVDKIEKSIALEKSSLFKGLNTFQLLKNEVGIAERLYYNKTKDINQFDGYLRATQLKKEDSIRLDFKFTTEEKLNLSASILHQDNLSNRSHHDIIKTLRIRPYVDLEDYNRFFRGFSMKDTEVLDLLLMMSEGRFSDNIAGSTSPRMQFERKNGFDQILYLKQKISPKDQLIIGLESKFNKEIVRKIDSSRALFFKNQYPVIGEEVQFSIISKDREFKGPKLNLKTEVTFKDNHSINLTELDTIANDYKISLSKNRLISNFKGATKLDEVVIKAPKKVEKRDITVVGRKEEVTERLYRRFFKLSVYLRTKGYLVNDDPGIFFVNNYYPRSINSGTGVLIVLDGTPLYDASILSGVFLDQFESITIDKNGFGYGIRGASGVIKLQSRRTPLFEKEFSKPFTKIQIDKGFEDIDNFSIPNFSNFDDIVFKSLGTISWKPVLILNDGEGISQGISFKIKDTGLNNLIIHVEGISESGILHSYKIPLMPNSKSTLE